MKAWLALQLQSGHDATVQLDILSAKTDMPDFTVAILDWALASSVAVTLDALGAANRIAASLGAPARSWKVFGSSAAVPLSNGLLIPAQTLGEAEDFGASLVVVPGLGLDHPSLQQGGDGRFDWERIAGRLELPDARRVIDRIRAHGARGGLVAASCSGVLVLGEAGLLDGRAATTHWRLAGLLQRRYPACRPDVARMVVRDGPVVTAGAALAQMDLMLVLIGEAYGHEIADLVARYLLMDGRPSQSCYMAWSHLQNTDETVKRLEGLIEQCLPEVPPLAVLADQLHVTEKTLARRVRRATGQTPGGVVQAVRLRRARHLLETTRLPVAEIASRVGYADATALRRLTLKTLHLAPGQLRGRPAAGPS